MSKKIIFEIETITPMFLSGADQSKAELRGASIKGLLRFWWRALQAESNIDELRKKESQIFGSSDEKKGGGSSFSLRILHDGQLKTIKEKFPKQNITVTSKGRSFLVNILEYLAYGTLEYKRGEGNVFVREYIPTNTKFNLIIASKDSDISEVLKAFYVFYLFGGIGSRSRNGFGSFQIVNIEKVFESIKSDLSMSQPYSDDNLKKLVKQQNGAAPYSAFSKDIKVFKANNSFDTWDKALGKIGKIYRGIRSSDLKKDSKPFESKHQYDKRQYIGSPIIVDKKEKSLLERHAKPYFIKVAKEGNKYRSYILYLPSQYCIGLEKGRNERQINHSTANSEFLKICNEFNGFLAQHMETII